MAEDTVVSGWWVLPLDKGFAHFLEILRRLPLAIRYLSSADGVGAGADRELFVRGAGDCILTRAIERVRCYLDLASPLLSPPEVADLDMFALVQEDVFWSQIAVEVVKALEPGRSACDLLDPAAFAIPPEWVSRIGD